MTIKHLYPTQRPSLDLNFASTKRLDPRVTFTRGSTATYVGNDGLIKTAAADEARFDHDPLTGESLGLLVEESRTNLLTYSNSLSHIYTSLVGVTKTTNAAVAPDGTSSAVLLAETATTDAHYLRFNESTNGRSFSVYVKPAGRTRFRIWSQGGNPFAAFLLTGDGSVTDSSSSTASIEKYPNGWYRCTMTSTTSDTGGLRIGPVNYSPTIQNNTWQSSYTGDGSSGVYVWGSQLETGSFPTSYIPTDGTPGGIARAADVASITGSNFSSWYNQDEGTIFAEAKMSFALSQYKFPDIYTSGSFPNRLWALYFLNVGNQLTIGADAHSVTLETFTSSPQSFKVAQALSNTSLTYSASKDGENVLTGSLSKAITNTSSISIGGNTVGAVKHIARLTYYPQRLPDATLQALTL